MDSDMNDLQPHELVPEPIPERKWWQKAIRIIVLLIVLASIASYFIFYQLLFFRDTPDGIEQAKLESLVPGEAVLTVPLNVFIVARENETGRPEVEIGSKRSQESVDALVNNASNIWAQASVELETIGVHELYFDEVSEKEFKNNIHSLVVSLEAYDDEAINVFLTRNLQGINGVAYIGTNTVAVADLTTSFDFRVLAHEVGHVLGLGHVSGANSLMHSGARGNTLSSQEIVSARKGALNLGFE